MNNFNPRASGGVGRALRLPADRQGGNLFLHVHSFRMVRIPLYLRRPPSLFLRFRNDRICEAMKKPLPGQDDVTSSIYW